MSFTNRLKEFRSKNQMSQQAVANAAGVYIRLYQYYEAGEREPAVRTAIRLARVLGTTVEELFPPEKE